MKAGSERRRILHCITSLDADGAQQMLLKISANIPAHRYEFRILNLRQHTDFAGKFERQGIPVESLNMRRGVPSPGAFRRMARAIDDFRPDLIQGWMYHGNIAALAAARLAKHKALVAWNIRKSMAQIRDQRIMTRAMVRAGAALSNRVSGVIYCGEEVAEQHLALGYFPGNRFVIPNGFDAERFKPSRQHADASRTALNISPGTKVIAMFARFHADKDHGNFLRMAGMIGREFADVRFLLAGRGVDSKSLPLMSQLEKEGISDRVLLLGERSDVDRLLPMVDVYCQSSSSEGFPNALGEAMACGAACVTTDAGSSREVTGDTGSVVPIRDSKALADAVRRLLILSAEERRVTGLRARERILGEFSLAAVSKRYDRFYSDLLAKTRAADFQGEISIGTEERV